MKIFPAKELKFKLVDDQAATLQRLNRRTEKSESLTSQFTNKSFRGIVKGNQFKLISSKIGRGAFCVMCGAINADGGNVKVKIHKFFRVLLSIFLLLPIIRLIAIPVNGVENFSLTHILVAVGQILIIRYAFIGLAFNLLSKESLNTLRDVLDLEWIKT